MVYYLVNEVIEFNFDETNSSIKVDSQIKFFLAPKNSKVKLFYEDLTSKKWRIKEVFINTKMESIF